MANNVYESDGIPLHAPVRDNHDEVPPNQPQGWRRFLKSPLMLPCSILAAAAGGALTGALAMYYSSGQSSSAAPSVCNIEGPEDLYTEVMNIKGTTTGLNQGPQAARPFVNIKDKERSFTNQGKAINCQILPDFSYTYVNTSNFGINADPFSLAESINGFKLGNKLCVGIFSFAVTNPVNGSDGKVEYPLAQIFAIASNGSFVPGCDEASANISVSDTTATGTITKSTDQAIQDLLDGQLGKHKKVEQLYKRAFSRESYTAQRQQEILDCMRQRSKA